MKFGVRECANIVFRAKQKTQIGKNTFNVGQPVLYIDTATASSMEQASTSVYAQGGRGNARLIAWEGDKTLTFTLTDALISPVSLAMLSGAGLVKDETAVDGVHVHATTRATMEIKNGNGEIELIDALRAFGPVTGEDRVMVDAGSDAPIYIIKTEDDGSITGEIVTSVSDITFAYSQDGKSAKLTIPAPLLNNTGDTLTQGMNVMVDY